MARVMQTLGAGLRLRCPNCREGRIYEGLRKNTACPSCGVLFERAEEGDFLVTVVFVYSLTAVLVALMVFLLNYALPELHLYTQIGLCLLFGLGFSLAVYRNLKGLSVALLHLTFGLRSTRSSGSSDR